MYRLVWVLALALFPSLASAQTGCTPETQAQMLSALADNQAPGSITPQTMRNIVCSTGNAQVTATGSTAARTLADRFSQVINVKDYGAHLDTRADNPNVTINASSASLAISNADFSSSDVGKAIIVDGAGAASATGYVSSVPVGSAGSGYTSVPTITLGNVGGGTLAIARANMALQSASVASGGAGCTNGTQTFTLDTTATPTTDGSRALAFAQVSGTVSGGVLSGTLTVVAAGNYISLPTTVTAVSASGPGCTTAPTINASFGVGSVYVAIGAGYPSGVTASISGGSPGVAATLGTPVVTFPVAPLVTTISGFTDSSHVTLASPANTSVSNAQEFVTWGHDDTSAWTAAINAAATAAAGSVYRYTIYEPPGDSLVLSTIPALTSNTSIRGDGVNISKVRMGPAYSGDLFSWSDAWQGNSYIGDSVRSTLTGGVGVSGIHIIGDRGAQVAQNAISCYDHCDYVFVFNAQIDKVPGRGVYMGAIKNDSASYTRESHFKDVRLWYDGAPGIAAFDITTNSTGDTTNTWNMGGVDIYAPYGPGMWIHGVGGAPRGIYANYIRIEGLENGTTAADLLEIGDPSQNIAMHGIDLRQLAIIDPYQGFAGIHVTAPSSSFTPYGLYLDGGVSGTVNAGKGLQVDFARNSTFALQINTVDTGVVVAANAGGLLTFNDNGQSSQWTWSIDSTETNAVRFPSLCEGANSNTIGGSAMLTCGNGNINSGTQTIVLGTTNQVSSAQSFIFGTGNAATSGNQQYMLAHASKMTGQVDFFAGQDGSDRGRFGWFGFGSAQFAAQGDRQFGWQPIGGITSGNTAKVLTADQAAAGAANTINLPNKGAYGFNRVVVTAYDPTGLNACMFYVDSLLVKRGATASATSIVGTPTVTQSQCDSALTTSSLSATADTTNGGVAFTFTGPAGINLHVQAAPETIEVQ